MGWGIGEKLDGILGNGTLGKKRALMQSSQAQPKLELGFQLHGSGEVQVNGVRPRSVTQDEVELSKSRRIRGRSTVCWVAYQQLGRTLWIG